MATKTAKKSKAAKGPFEVQYESFAGTWLRSEHNPGKPITTLAAAKKYAKQGVSEPHFCGGTKNYRVVDSKGNQVGSVLKVAA